MLAGCGPKATEPGALRFEGQSMGTTWHVTLLPPAQGDTRDWNGLIQGALDRVDGAMSTYKSTSDLSRLAAAPAGTAGRWDPWTIECLTLAREVHAASDGVSTPTLGPLVRLWALDPVATRSPIPPTRS
ncbi:MAG: FAD:protein FMN transferase [Planctomycetota bacterium]